MMEADGQEICMPLHDLRATEELAARIAPCLSNGQVVLLRGDLGVGKTTFARALLRCLGVQGDVPSPTFTLVQTYDTPSFQVHHFDLYRLESADELEEIGFYDALADGVALIEWPEKAENAMPKRRMEIIFEKEGQERSCRILF